MPKYLISASYSAEGLRGLQKDKASGRRSAVTAAVEGLGGKVECFYNALGQDDAYVIVDLPDNISAAALGVTVSAAGLARTRTTALLTVEETDRALEKSVNYRAAVRTASAKRLASAAAGRRYARRLSPADPLAAASTIRDYPWR